LAGTSIHEALKQLNYHLNLSSDQYFPTFSGLRHPTEEHHNLLHQVVNPQQFTLRFDDILKTYFNDIL